MKKTTIARIFGLVLLLALLAITGYTGLTGMPQLLLIFGTAFAFEKLVVNNIKDEK